MRNRGNNIAFFIYLILGVQIFSNVDCAISNIFKRGQELDLQFYVSDSPKFTFPVKQSTDGVAVLVWEAKNINFTDEPGFELKYQASKQSVYPVTQKMQMNGTIYAHVLITPAGSPPTPNDPFTVYHGQAISNYLPRNTVKKTRNLLFDPPTPEEEISSRIVSFWKPKIKLHLVTDLHQYESINHMSPFIRNQLRLSGNRFAPVVYINTVNVVDQSLIPVNSSISFLPIDITYSPMGIDQWAWYKQLEATFQYQKSSLGSTDRELEDVKGIFLETSPTLLYVTAIVAFFHLLFDFLAFKNDIGFWKNTKTMVGLSSKTIIMNAVSQSIILLYLWENDTSMLVLGSVGIGLVIEFWKIFRSLKLSQSQRYQKSKTREFDDKAMKYVGISLFVVVIVYSGYSLVYHLHTGWYGWLISSLVSIVYTFGFVRMTPQLFINYQLKSVAQLPWRVFVYKAINTFIDDLFAFIIKMPTMHRLACFRDDVVFFIYLYQRWIYPVDTSRSESADDEQEVAETKKEQ